jgi:hypothetical protein
MWHVINKEVGKSWKCDKKIELNDGTQIISNPQNVAGMLSTFFMEIIDDLLNQNSSTINAVLKPYFFIQLLNMK